MPPIIDVKDLCKDFRTFRRREGVWGAIQNLFVRDRITVRAVEAPILARHSRSQTCREWHVASGERKNLRAPRRSSGLVVQGGRMPAEIAERLRTQGPKIRRAIAF